MTPLPARVVHVASGREWRGGQRQVALLASGLARAQVDQLVITTRGSRLAHELTISGVPTRAVGWYRGLSFRALAAVIAEARRGPTILHAHDAHGLVLAGIAATLTRAALIVTRRVDFHIRRPGFWVRADRVIAISEAVRKILIQDGVSPARIPLVHSGIDLETTRLAQPGDIRRQLGLPDGPLAVSVAALVAHKDHETMLHTAALVHERLPDLHWALAGAGDLRDRLEALARDLGIASHIHFLGHVDEPLRLIAAGTVFVMTSEEEGLGTSVLDAMALGIPVVATRAGGIPEMLEGGAGFLENPKDTAALATAVEKAVTSPAARRTVLDRATHAVERFGSDGMAAGVLQVYRSALLER